MRKRAGEGGGGCVWGGQGGGRGACEFEGENSAHLYSAIRAVAQGCCTGLLHKADAVGWHDTGEWLTET